MTPRKKKTASSLDFSLPPPSDAVLFATTGASINLSKLAVKNLGDNLLPSDLQFNSARFTTLFMKPSIKVKIGSVARMVAANANGEAALEGAVDVFKMDKQGIDLIL